VPVDIAFATDLSDDLLRLLVRQEGLATRRQLFDHDITRGAKRSGRRRPAISMTVRGPGLTL
jgi:hypothetical protein